MGGSDGEKMDSSRGLEGLLKWKTLVVGGGGGRIQKVRKLQRHGMFKISGGGMALDCARSSVWPCESC